MYLDSQINQASLNVPKTAEARQRKHLRTQHNNRIKGRSMLTQSYAAAEPMYDEPPMSITSPELPLLMSGGTAPSDTNHGPLSTSDKD